MKVQLKRGELNAFDRVTDPDGAERFPTSAAAELTRLATICHATK